MSINLGLNNHSFQGAFKQKDQCLNISNQHSQMDSSKSKLNTSEEKQEFSGLKNLANVSLRSNNQQNLFDQMKSNNQGLIMDNTQEQLQIHQTSKFKNVSGYIDPIDNKSLQDDNFKQKEFEYSINGLQSIIKNNESDSKLQKSQQNPSKSHQSIFQINGKSVSNYKGFSIGEMNGKSVFNDKGFSIGESQIENGQTNILNLKSSDIINSSKVKGNDQFHLNNESEGLIGLSGSRVNQSKRSVNQSKRSVKQEEKHQYSANNQHQGSKQQPNLGENPADESDPFEQKRNSPNNFCDGQRQNFNMPDQDEQWQKQSNKMMNRSNVSDPISEVLSLERQDATNKGIIDIDNNIFEVDQNQAFESNINKKEQDSMHLNNSDQREFIKAASGLRGKSISNIDQQYQNDQQPQANLNKSQSLLQQKHSPIPKIQPAPVQKSKAEPLGGQIQTQSNKTAGLLNNLAHSKQLNNLRPSPDSISEIIPQISEHSQEMISSLNRYSLQNNAPNSMRMTIPTIGKDPSYLNQRTPEKKKLNSKITELKQSNISEAALQDSRNTKKQTKIVNQPPQLGLHNAKMSQEKGQKIQSQVGRISTPNDSVSEEVKNFKQMNSFYQGGQQVDSSVIVGHILANTKQNFQQKKLLLQSSNLQSRKTRQTGPSRENKIQIRQNFNIDSLLSKGQIYAPQKDQQEGVMINFNNQPQNQIYNSLIHSQPEQDTQKIPKDPSQIHFQQALNNNHGKNLPKQNYSSIQNAIFNQNEERQINQPQKIDQQHASGHKEPQIQQVDDHIDEEIHHFRQRRDSQENYQIFQSENFELEKQQVNRKRVQTEFNQKIQPKGHQSKFTHLNPSHLNPNHLHREQSQHGSSVFQTQVLASNLSLANAKLAKIRQAKQYKKKKLQQQLLKISEQINHLSIKQAEIRQFGSPVKNYNDRLKINNDDQARKKAISMVKNLQKDRKNRQMQKIQSFDKIDGKINNYMSQLTKIRSENQRRLKEKKKLQIIERMKIKEMKKINETKKIQANSKFVSQFNNNQMRPSRQQLLTPLERDIASPDSRKKTHSKQEDYDSSLTPELANKKAYLNKVRNLSIKKNLLQQSDRYQNRLN